MLSTNSSSSGYQMSTYHPIKWAKVKINCIVFCYIFINTSKGKSSSSKSQSSKKTSKSFRNVKTEGGCSLNTKRAASDEDSQKEEKVGKRKKRKTKKRKKSKDEDDGDVKIKKELAQKDVQTEQKKDDNVKIKDKNIVKLKKSRAISSRSTSRLNNTGSSLSVVNAGM
jgi:hypothetical protein